MSTKELIAQQVTAVIHRFGAQGVQFLDIERQADDLHRVLFSWNGLRFHYVIDEEAPDQFVLELSELVVLDENAMPGVLRAAMAAFNRLHGRLHYVRCLLVPIDPDPAMLFAIDVDPSTTRAALGWLLEPEPDQRAYLTLNFGVPLFDQPDRHRLDAFDQGMAFLTEGARLILTDLYGAGFPVQPNGDTPGMREA